MDEEDKIILSEKEYIRSLNEIFNVINNLPEYKHQYRMIMNIVFKFMRQDLIENDLDLEEELSFFISGLSSSFEKDLDLDKKKFLSLLRKGL